MTPSQLAKFNTLAPSNHFDLFREKKQELENLARDVVVFYLFVYIFVSPIPVRPRIDSVPMSKSTLRSEN